MKKLDFGVRRTMLLENMLERACLLDIMRCDMDDGEEQHRVGRLAMEPLRLVERQPS